MKTACFKCEAPHSYRPLSSPWEQKRRIEVDLVVLRATGALGSADLEAVLEAAVDFTEVGHSAGTGGLASLGLLAPVELASLSSGVSAVRASRLLDVVGAAATTAAQSVSLVVALAEAGGTLRYIRCQFANFSRGFGSTAADVLILNYGNWRFR
jgi:hypothetical protein